MLNALLGVKTLKSLIATLPHMLGSRIHMQNAMHCEMLVQCIKPCSKETTYEAHSYKDQNILYVPQVTVLLSMTL